MKPHLTVVLALCVLIFCGRVTYGAEKIRVANGGFGTAINAVLPAAYHKKIYQKYGIEAEYIALDSGTIGMQTLLANEIQILFTTGALAVTANLQGAGPRHVDIVEKGGSVRAASRAFQKRHRFPREHGCPAPALRHQP